MRFLLATSALATLSLLACSGSSEDAIAGDSALANSSTQAACSPTYWNWVLHELEPRMDRPVTEVSDEELQSLVASHPASKDTVNSYSICWTPIFDKHFVGGALKRLHDANTMFVDQNSPDYKSYDSYRANIAMTPELRRNAKALLALRPSTMTPSDASVWMSTYGDVLAEVIHPVALPGLHGYDPDAAESEWQITDAEAEYLAVVEKAKAAPSKDGVYGEWVRDFGHWLFGPPPAVTRSFVFNLPFEPGATGDAYGLSGIVLQQGLPVLPPLVKSFESRLEASRPPALGSEDSAAWMSLYNARSIRALGNLPQQQPMLDATDTLALDLLEQVKPEQLRGASTYDTWLDLVVLAKGFDASWTRRFLALEPCVDTSDLAATQRSYTEKTTSLPANTVPAPRACAR